MLITGIILGAVQSWGLGPAVRRPASGSRRPPSGFAVGLGVGAAAVGYGTSMGDLVVQGAICGLAIGTAQAVVLRPRLGRLAFAWVPRSARCGRSAGRSPPPIGVDVERQYTVFGSSGALSSPRLTVVLPVLLATRRPRAA